MDLAETLRRLREERALSRDALAALASVSDMTIRRIEAGGYEGAKRSTMVSILTSLQRISPVEERDARLIADAAGIPAAVLDGLRAQARALEVRTQLEPTSYIEARSALEQLVARVGAARAADMVRAMLVAAAMPSASVLPASLPAALPPPLVADHEVDGALYRVRRYSPASASPPLSAPAAAAPPAARSAKTASPGSDRVPRRRAE